MVTARAVDGDDMKIGSLFAGIGGLDLGLERAGHEVVWQVENDPYAVRVLEKHWPHVRRWDDVCTFPPVGDWSCDCICGGFPCVNISQAGRREGIDGDQSGLWAEFSRIVRHLRPRYVLVENVSALLVRGMDRVLGDLATGGYDAQWDCVPAAALHAHHLRDRTFIVANRADTVSLRREGGWPAPVESDRWGWDEFARLVRLETEHGIPAGSLGRVSDGVRSRVDRLRCLGNAVVPQVAEYIGRWLTDLALDTRESVE